VASRSDLLQAGQTLPCLDGSGPAGHGPGVNDMPTPALSITMPTRNRPELLERALRSVVRAVTPVAQHVEVAVSDGSDDGTTGDVVKRILTDWPAGYRYVWNRPALSLVENMNRAVEISNGRWVMQLDDDDYLLDGAGAAMLDAIRRGAPSESVLMFGVQIVDGDGVRRRQQTFPREQFLEPKEALRRLLRNSSFVREPTVVVRRAAIEQEGLFDITVGDVTDTDMWVRLFSRYGVRCLPQVTCAYTIHEAAATTGMWNPGTILASGEIFDRAVARGIVPERTIRRWQADWYHQFILAGAYRRLRIRRRAEAREVLRLFDLPDVRARGLSPKWLPVRAAFTAVTMGARSEAGRAQ
jgi:glycosyltransferase involved in cell wall biosynthesis